MLKHADRCLAATVGVRSARHPGVGSGVIVSADGLVLTAGHCVPEPGGPMEVVLPGGRVVKAKALGAEWDLDIGMVQLIGTGPWPFVELAPGSEPTKSEWCLASGHPGGVQWGRGPVLRIGRVRAEPVPGYPKHQSATDCRLMPGDSGGPLFDLAGRLIGIHCVASFGSAVSPRGDVPAAGSGAGHATMGSFRDKWDFLLAGKSAGVNQSLAMEDSGPATASAPKRDGAAKPKADAPTLEALTKKWSLDDEVLMTLNTLKRQLPPETFDDILGQLDEQYTASNGKPERMRLAIRPKGGPVPKLDGAQSGERARRTLPSGVQQALETITQPADSAIVEILKGKTRTGFGTVVGENLVVTKASELPDPVICRYGENTATAKVISKSDENDLALLEVTLAGTKPVTWADDCQVGQIIAARAGTVTEFGVLSHPPRRVMTAEAARREGFLGTAEDTELERRRKKTEVLNGVLGERPNTRRDGFPWVLTHDLDLRADECGTPLMNLQGEAIGVNIAREGLATNLAIPARIVRNLVSQWRRIDKK